MPSTSMDNVIKFSDSQIRALIAAVKKRPVIWSSDRKNKPEKIKCWEDIFEELHFEKMQLDDLKKKWAVLRSQSKAFWRMLNVDSYGHGPLLTREVCWKFYEDLLFLYDNVGARECEPMSTSELDVDYTIKADDGFDPYELNLMLLEPEIEIGEDSLMVSFPTSRSGNSSEIETTELHQSKNAAFCNYLLSELCAMPQEHAPQLRRLLEMDIQNFMGYHRKQNHIDAEHIQTSSD